MKDNRFIELVNLYIDRQISAEETAELEAEMQANPKRRAVYRQYCQLHTATKQVYAGFRAHAPEAQEGAAPGRVVRAEFSRRARSNWIHYAGGLAAAACLAIVFVRYNAGSPPPEIIADTTKAPVMQGAVASAAKAVVNPVVTSIVPATLMIDTAPVAEPDFPALLRQLRQEDQRAFASGQIQPGQLPSLFDDGVFDSRPVLLPTNNQRVFRGKQAPEQKAEFTAFQFQR